jgi:hypothetical protein
MQVLHPRWLGAIDAFVATRPNRGAKGRGEMPRCPLSPVEVHGTRVAMARNTMTTHSPSLIRLALVALWLVLPACTGPVGEKGSSCSTKDNGNGTVTVSCTDGTSVTLANGTNGTNGSNGDAGTACSITTKSDGGRIVSCTDGTVADLPNGTACTIASTDAGRTISCSDGTVIAVTNGTNGTNGTNTVDAFRVDQFHGTGFLDKAALAATGKYLAKMTITSATASATGQVIVKFKVADTANKAVPGIKVVNANIVKLLPADADAGEAFNKWVAYIYRTQTVSGSDGGNWPNPDGTKAFQPNRESNGSLVDNNDGSYVYTFATNLSNITVNGQPIPFERNRTHRIAVMIGGSSGPTCDGFFDFVPDGAPITENRRLIDTDNCRTCHGEQFRAHGGDRLTIEVCATCHLPGAFDPHGGASIDLEQMIHKIHAGGELASIPGPDGIVWDNPATLVNEAFDNGSYAIWGFNNTKAEWWKAGFPAVLSNCTKCHNDVPHPGQLPQVANFKNVPSRKACGSCHDLTNFVTGVNHVGGAMTTDNACSVCHPASGTIVPNLIAPITTTHDFTRADSRNIPEFAVDVSLDVPARGFYVAGEAPVVTMVVKENGAPINHTTIFQDLDGPEGCLPGTPVALDGGDNCPPRDGKFSGTALLVHGPRALRNPVLTTAARTRLLALSQATYNLGAIGNTMTVVVDNAEDLKRQFDTVSTILKGTFVVAVPASGFVDRTAATPLEIIAWLNATPAFKARAIAYLDEATGRLAIRSRNFGKFFAIQVLASPLSIAIFNDPSVKNLSGYYASNTVAQQWNLDGGAPTAPNDPKASWTAGAIKYQLDPVDDLVAGTYTASIEFKDRGGATPSNYRTPTVAKKTFQVKQLAEERAVAGSCDTCHQSPETNKGLVFDFYRHYKILDGTAVDQCGGCHDYQNSNVTGSWGGAGAIARRVHAVHAGSTLDFPLLTVGYANGDPVPGRNWDIKFPEDLRNCQVCHSEAKSSGSWKSKPARLPCGGCHDSEAATAHMSIMTVDPTPANPFSGDEVESCKTCH